MTLSSRVRLAEAEGTAIRARDDGWMLDELKEDVGRIIPGDVLARLADENPRRARSELQSACKQAFASPRWAGRSNELKARLSRDLEDIVFGMGPLQSLVEDPTITEVMVNGTSSLFIERSGLLERETAYSLMKRRFARLSIAFWLRLVVALMKAPPWSTRACLADIA